MKAIIQRALPLDKKYILIDKKYIPIEVSLGAYCCENCGKLISNIATVQSEGKRYNIGFDCLETILINNSLLSTGDVNEYQKYKKMIPKIIRFGKELKELIELNKKNGIVLNAFKFEKPRWNTDWVVFYLIAKNCKPYNDGKKLKDVDFYFLIETLCNILKGQITESTEMIGKSNYEYTTINF